MRIFASGLRFPEGPIAMADGSVLVVEIERGTLTRAHPDGRLEVVAEIAGAPNGAAMGPDGRIFICNSGGYGWIREGATLRPGRQSKTYTGGGIDVVDLATGKVERLYERCGENPLKGPNDLVFDGQGGFWFTDMGKLRQRDLDLGFIYWARADGSEIREVIGGMITPNGIGLSPDGQRLYVAETIPGRLWSWEIVAPGKVRKRPWPATYGATFVGASGGAVRFDSLAVAASGNICLAALDACAILEMNPDGIIVRRHAAPDMLVTNLCFGGSGLRTAYVTLSHQGVLAALDWPDAGLPLHHVEYPQQV